MATSFLALPTLAADGAGAGVDVSAMGALKTIVVEGNGSTEPFIAIQAANDAAGVNWTTIAFFKTPGEQTLEIACRWLRAVTVNYQGGGASTVNVGGNDDGATFATLVAPVGDGNGAGVDVSALPSFKTVQITGDFRGAVNIEVSNDGGTTYSNAMTFLPGRTGMRSALLVGEFMRINRSGIPLGKPAGLPVITVGAADPSGGGAVGGGVDLENNGVALAGGPFSTLDLIGITAVDAGGGTATLTASASGGGDRTWYGNGVDGDLVVATGTVVVLGANVHYDNVTVETNACLYMNAWSLHVAGTLLVEGTGTVEASGGNGGNGNSNGAGGNTNAGLTLKSGYVIGGQPAQGANGLQGRSGGAGVQNGNGTNGAQALALLALHELLGTTGGAGGDAGGNTGGAGGTNDAEGTCYANPYVGEGKTAEEPTDFSNWVTGGAGGGGGAGANGGTGGKGGGGGGVARIYAFDIDCPDGALRSNGGNGGAGSAVDAGGGGGGQGGVLLIITEALAAAKCDVTGGNGGAPAGAGTAGANGDPGAVVALSPSGGPLF